MVESSSEIKEDTANSTTSETAVKEDVDNQNIQPKATENIDDWMPDKNLQTVVSKTLNISVSNITKNDMLKLKRLDANEKGISNITGLEYASNVTLIELKDNQISDVTPLQNLTSLTDLVLGNNQISDLTPLQNLTSLTSLQLANNQISDVTPLQNLTSLDELYLDNNQISDISSLPQSIRMISADRQSVVLPEVYVHNRKPYSISIESPIKGYNGLVSLSPQNNGTWTGVYNSGKVEWSGGDQVLEKGELSSTWRIQDGNKTFSGTYVQPYILSKATTDTNSNSNSNSNSGENKKNENQKPMSTNEKDKALPSTGEKSSVWLFMSGIVFIFASVLALLRFKKK